MLSPDVSDEAAQRQGLHLNLPALPEQIREARHAVAAFLRRLNWPADDSDSLLLALGEACSNAVSYGGRGLTDPRLLVSCEPMGDNWLCLEVQNHGSGFRPDLSRLSALPDDEFAEHGRGFGLMLALVDSVQVLSEGENTVVRLLKTRTP